MVLRDFYDRDLSEIFPEILPKSSVVAVATARENRDSSRLTVNVTLAVANLHRHPVVSAHVSQTRHITQLQLRFCSCLSGYAFILVRDAIDRGSNPTIGVSEESTVVAVFLLATWHISTTRDRFVRPFQLLNKSTLYNYV